MKFYMPVRIYEGEGCVLARREEISSFGTKALIVTGRSSARKCGALQDVTEALEKCRKTWCIFSEVEENPSTQTIMKAREYGLSEGADFVIGIGGGSPLDAAKAAAFMMFHRDCQEDRLYDASLSPEALPVIAVPTTCGTGSEVTGVSVLTRHDKKTKGSIPARIFPKLALIDGRYLKAAPLSVIASTSLDALAHLMESALQKTADDYSCMAVEKGLSIWSGIKDILTGERKASAEDYAALMRSAAFGGIAIAQTGTSIPHALSYPVTYDMGLAHGRAAAYFLPGFLSCAPEEIRSRLLSLTGFPGIEEFQAYVEKVLGEIAVPQETLERCFEMVKDNSSRMDGCVFPMDEKSLAGIVYRKKTGNMRY